jgi:hypothetical protein
MEHYCALKATETVVENVTPITQKEKNNIPHMTQLRSTEIWDVDNISLMEIDKICIQYYLKSEIITTS